MAIVLFFVIKMKTAELFFWGNRNCSPLSLIKSPRLEEKVHVPAVTLWRDSLFSFQHAQCSCEHFNLVWISFFFWWFSFQSKDFHQFLFFSWWTVNSSKWTNYAPTTYLYFYFIVSLRSLTVLDVELLFVLKFIRFLVSFFLLVRETSHFSIYCNLSAYYRHKGKVSMT